MTRRSAYANYGCKAGPASPRRPGVRSDRNDDTGYCILDGAGAKENLPRPPAAMSVDSVYSDAPFRDASTPHSARTPNGGRSDYLEKNCSRSFVWSTLESVAIRPYDVAAHPPLPLSVVCSPFSDGADSDVLPVSDVGESGAPLRCSRCRCYANAFCSWIRKDRRTLQCNMCQHETEMPRELLAEVDGASLDEEHRPELFYGSVNIPVSQCLGLEREASEPVVFFVLETSADAIASGFFASALDAIEALLEDSEAALRRRIGLALFDSELHFFVPSRSGRFRRLAVACQEDPYVPDAPGALFVDTRSPEVRDSFRDLLACLRESAEESSAEFAAAPRCCIAGDALRAAVEAVSAVGGGDIMMLQASSTSRGLGAPLRPTPPELTAAPQHPVFYKEMLASCTRGGVAVNMVTAPAPGIKLDVETLQWLVWQTGGDALHLQGFGAERAAHLGQHFRHWVGKMQGSAYGCIVRLRCSKGLTCTTLLAPWSAASTSSDSSAFELPRLSPDVSFAFTLKAEPADDSDLSYPRFVYDNVKLYVQMAVLYTNVKGKRYLRLHTSCINAAPTMRNVYQSASVGPILALGVKRAALAALAAQASAAVGKKPPKQQPRDILLDILLDALAGFRRHCYNGRVTTSTVVIHKRLCLLPLLTLGARKLLYAASNAPCNELLYRLVRMPVHSLLAAVYPRVYPIELRSGGDDEDDAAVTEGDASCSTSASTAVPGILLPTPLAPLQESIAKGHAPGYLISNGLAAYVHLAPSDARSSSSEDDTALLQAASALAAQLRDALEPTPVAPTMSDIASLSMSAEQTKEQKVFVSTLFVEDQGFTEMSYLDWVQHLNSCLRRDT